MSNWESPIKAFATNMRLEYENGILKAVMFIAGADCMREELIAHLEKIEKGS